MSAREKQPKMSMEEWKARAEVDMKQARQEWNEIQRKHPEAAAAVGAWFGRWLATCGIKLPARYLMRVTGNYPRTGGREG